eukprot:SAG11_NODE_772_length_7254_cov_1.857582_5_plen_204_part_00
MHSHSQHSRGRTAMLIVPTEHVFGLCPQGLPALGGTLPLADRAAAAKVLMALMGLPWCVQMTLPYSVVGRAYQQVRRSPNSGSTVRTSSCKPVLIRIVLARERLPSLPLCSRQSQDGDLGLKMAVLNLSLCLSQLLMTALGPLLLLVMPRTATGVFAISAPLAALAVRPVAFHLGSSQAVVLWVALTGAWGSLPAKTPRVVVQ